MLRWSAKRRQLLSARGEIKLTDSLFHLERVLAPPNLDRCNRRRIRVRSSAGPKTRLASNRVRLMLGTRTSPSAQRASARSECSKEISLQLNSRCRAQCGRGRPRSQQQAAHSGADDFLGKVGATPSDGTYRKPQSVFPSKRACRFASSRDVRAREVPGYHASQRRCPISGWRRNGGAHAG